MRKPALACLWIVLAAAYWRGLRRRICTWGATEEEARSRLPGDELLEAADGVATRAITVERLGAGAGDDQQAGRRPAAARV